MNPQPQGGRARRRCSRPGARRARRSSGCAGRSSRRRRAAAGTGVGVEVQREEVVGARRVGLLGAHVERHASGRGSRVRTTRQPSARSSSARRRPTASVRSFSLSPDGETTPASWPPWPGVDDDDLCRRGVRGGDEALVAVGDLLALAAAIRPCAGRRACAACRRRRCRRAAGRRCAGSRSRRARPRRRRCRARARR